MLHCFRLTMSKTPTLLSLCYLTILILMPTRALLANSDCLKIRMIHPDSTESPFFQSNLSNEEKIKRLVSQSNLRANHLATTLSSSSFVGTKIDVQAFHYILKIGIGTFNSKPPYKEYYLDMDTGSDLVWMQCEGCTKCFDQTPKPFPAKSSSSFRAVLDKTTPKPYKYTYADGSSTNGILAHETFHLRSKSGNLAKIANIKFGCGLHNDMHYNSFSGNKIAGIMGLGWNDLSFVKQLRSKINGKFSYCLPLLSGRMSNTYLSFGDDCKCPLKSTKKTPLYRINGTSPYFVDLQGISINKIRLKINSNAFAFKNSSGPGCIIDTGTPISRIKTPAFEILKQELEKYISRLKGLKKLKGCLGGLELCYERSKPEKRVDNLPEVTFHLRGSKADFVMKNDAVFKFFDQNQAVGSRERLCLAMVRDDMMSIIGSRQQVNQKITYDIKKSRLVFYQKDCAK